MRITNVATTDGRFGFAHPDQPFGRTIGPEFGDSRNVPQRPQDGRIGEFRPTSTISEPPAKVDILFATFVSTKRPQYSNMTSQDSDYDSIRHCFVRWQKRRRRTCHGTVASTPRNRRAACTAEPSPNVVWAPAHRSRPMRPGVDRGSPAPRGARRPRHREIRVLQRRSSFNGRGTVVAGDDAPYGVR